MKSTKQRNLIVCILVSLVLLAGIILLIPNIKSANAETIESNDKLNFTQITNEDGELSYKVAVKPAYRSSVEFIVVPETYNGLAVTEVAANGFVSCAKLTKVILPETVRVLGINAFMNCAKLKFVSMPCVESIGTNAFGMCMALDRLFIPETVMEVGSNILRNNSNTVYVQSSVEVIDIMWSSTWSNYFTGEIMYSVDPQDTIQYREVLATDNKTVIGYEIKEEQYLSDVDADIIIYNSVCVDEDLGYLPVLNICPEAFLFSQVKSITVRDRHADDSAAPPFSHKINIRSNAFLFVIAEEINIEVGVTFNHPENLQTDNPDSGFDSEPIVGDADGFSTRVFEESYIKSITLPSDMDLVTERMFYNCTYLESIKINGAEYDGVNKLPCVYRIGAQAFTSCIALKNINLPESVNYVGKAAFSDLGVNVDEQNIYVDIYEDEIPEGWDSDWAVNNQDNVKITYKPLTYITVVLDSENSLSLGVKPGRLVPDIEDAIVRTGYIFKGIYSGMNGFGFQYYSSNLQAARVWNEGDPATLYVNWELIKYNIEYVVDLKGQKNPNPTQYTVEDEITFIDLEKDGYKFGWDIKAIPKGTTGNITVTGNWENNEYNITYDVDLKGLTNPNPTVYEVGEEIIFEPLYKEGYNFEWFPAKIEADTIGDVTVKGIWTLIEYDITYKVWDGTENINPAKYDVEHHVTFAPATYYGYEVTWDKVSTNGCLGDITVTASYKCIDNLISCYNRETGIYEITFIGFLNELVSYDTKGKTFHVNVDYEGRVWTPIQIFSGTLTGEVRNIKLVPDYSSSVYGFIIYNHGTIENFTLDCTLEVRNSVVGGSRRIGTICGFNAGVVRNCVVESSKPLSYTMPDGQIVIAGILNTVDSNAHIGGVVGIGDPIGCENHSDIYGIGNIGGISADGAPINCTNYGTIHYYSAYSVGQYIGGIVASSDQEIKGCVNKGDIYYMNINAHESNFYPRIGGIVGFLNYTFTGVVVDCVNEGTIHTGTLKNTYYVGDIIGEEWSDDC